MYATFGKKIKMASVLTGIKLTDLIDLFNGTKPGKISERLEYDKFSGDEVQSFADAFGCKYVAEVIFPDGHRIENGDTRELLNQALEYSGDTKISVAKRLGITSGGFRKRMSIGTFGYDDAYRWAEAIGCKFNAYFDFGDGIRF